MIAKNIKRKSPGPFGRLAQYLAAAGEKDEKLDQLWAVNCKSGEDAQDLQHIINEVSATQALNNRAKGDKCYHLLVSLRSDDVRPSVETMRDIEQMFATALGFGEHQRVAATHQNTGNYHMHVAFNRIHPVTHKIHHPKHDYRALERTCRKVEALHALQVDKGRSDARERQQTPAGARDMEARTWEQSFARYVRELQPKLIAARASAKDWQSLHAGFGKYGLVLKPRGNGLAIADAGNKATSIKASTLDRAFSKTALEKQLGIFEPPQKEELSLAVRRYAPRPITRHTGQSKLWGRYQAGRNGLSALDRANYSSWRRFLEGEAPSDPLAMAILKAQRRLFNGITNAVDGAKLNGRTR